MISRGLKFGYRPEPRWSLMWRLNFKKLYINMSTAHFKVQWAVLCSAVTVETVPKAPPAGRKWMFNKAVVVSRLFMQIGCSSGFLGPNRFVCFYLFCILLVFLFFCMYVLCQVFQAVLSNFCNQSRQQDNFLTRQKECKKEWKTSHLCLSICTGCQ